MLALGTLATMVALTKMVEDPTTSQFRTDFSSVVSLCLVVALLLALTKSPSAPCDLCRAFGLVLWLVLGFMLGQPLLTSITVFCSGEG